MRSSPELLRSIFRRLLVRFQGSPPIYQVRRWLAKARDLTRLQKPTPEVEPCKYISNTLMGQISPFPVKMREPEIWKILSIHNSSWINIVRQGWRFGPRCLFIWHPSNPCRGTVYKSLLVPPVRSFFFSQPTATVHSLLLFSPQSFYCLFNFCILNMKFSTSLVSAVLAITAMATPTPVEKRAASTMCGNWGTVATVCNLKYLGEVFSDML